MNDFKAEPALLRQSMVNAVARVLESGWYVLGGEVKAFEREWADVCGVSNAVGVGNGMDAIEIALRGLDIGPGDEVITTSMTAFATVLAISRAGASPVLADINPSTGLLCPESVKRCISPTTKAVLLVHLYGQVRDMDTWTALCAEHQIYLLEDCAQAHLAHWKGRAAGSFGAAGMYSFYPTKNLGTVGDAGILVTGSEDLKNRAQRLRNYGQSERYFHPESGLNSRMDEIHAAILSERLKWLDQFTDRRRKIAKQYRAGISNNFVRLLSPPEEESCHVYHLFVVLTTEREALQARLHELEIQSLCHYPVPVHLQQPFLQISRDSLGLAECELFASHCLSIPCHPGLDDKQVALVIEAVNDFRSQ
ncbi:MAG: DegT/DnrJ/EryC1/StrS family aminotransferase [Halioglobus sp.]